MEQYYNNRKPFDKIEESKLGDQILYWKTVPDHLVIKKFVLELFEIVSYAAIIEGTFSKMAYDKKKNQACMKSLRHSRLIHKLK